MKVYRKHRRMVLLSIIGFLLFSFNAILNFMSARNSIAILYCVMSALWVFSYYIHKKPYLVLDDDKLTINYWLRKKEMPLAGLKISSESSDKIELLNKADNTRHRIFLRLLPEETRKEFAADLRKTKKVSRKK